MIDLRSIAFLLLLQIGAGNASFAASWHHHGGGSPSLKEVLANAAPGDTIHVHGEVHEGTITVEKPVVLIGHDGAVIDGDEQGEVLLIKADDVTIDGFTIRGSKISNLEDNAGIKASECRYTTIRNNFMDGCFFAIYLSGSKGAVVERNTIVGHNVRDDQMANGIHLWKCNSATIRNNTVRNHRDGIYFEFVTDSHILDNISTGHIRYGLHFMFSHRNEYIGNLFRDNGAGVAVMYSHHMIMRHNRFESNRGASAYGLLLKEINDGEVTDNLMMDNTTGLMVDGCNRITAERNEFRNNGWALRLFANALYCTFQDNAFIGNTFDLSSNGELKENVMDRNYWDRYVGYDLDHDKIGDTPHRPLGFFALLVERIPYAMVFSRSLFVSLLDRAERLLPTLTPAALKDVHPLLRQQPWVGTFRKNEAPVPIPVRSANEMNEMDHG
ncbi:MAG TPA: nitrous oxide reductase family maturation protein NosD [Flavobacteriales bacterium]|nr:nitrous oxide reductase family maturation protein NosD [Flavobacteriales bacterium]